VLSDKSQKKVKLLSYFSMDPPSHDITIVLAYTSKYSINTLCVQGVVLPYKNRIKNIYRKNQGNAKNVKKLTLN
jgi:hypothetical protein